MNAYHIRERRLNRSTAMTYPIKIDPVNKFEPFAAPQQFQQIHDASMEILCSTGMKIGSEKLVKLAGANGLKCDKDVVCFTERAVTDALSLVSNTFLLLARNPDHNIEFGMGKSHIGIGRSAPFVLTEEGRRRDATRADFIEFIKLGQMLDAVALQGNLVTPSDIPAESLFPFMMANQIRYSDKPYIVLDTSDLDLLCMAFGISRDQLKAANDRGQTYAQTTVNCISPLYLGENQVELLMVMAKHGIPICLSPTPAVGSSGPCSLAGTLLLNNCEVLAMLVLVQLVKPGLPVLYGTFPSSSDMRSMVAVYGSPESRIMERAAADMAKGYGLLTRGNIALTDAITPDFQAGAEAMFNVLNALQSNISYLPGLGILDGFAMASKEKLVLDAELVAYGKRFFQPLSTKDLDQMVDLIKRVGIRGSHVSSPHTFAHFRSELHDPAIFSRMTYDKWMKKKEPLVRSATERAEELLAGYVRPDLDRDLDRRLERMAG